MKFAMGLQDVDDTLVALDDFTFGGIPELECPTCKGGFVPKRQGHVYCSTKCRKKFAANRARPKGNRPRGARVYGQYSVLRSIALDEITAQQIQDYATRERQSFSAAVRDLFEWAIEDHIECRN